MIRADKWMFARLLMTLLALVALPTTAHADTPGIVSRADAERHGLHRQWITQIRLDPARHRVGQIAQYDSVLYVLTEGASIQAIDAETGRTLWTTSIGDPRYASLGPSANQQHVAAINGSHLVVLERATGREAWRRRIGSAAGAAPTLTETRAYAPLVSGVIEGYRLDPEE